MMIALSIQGSQDICLTLVGFCLFYECVRITDTMSAGRQDPDLQIFIIDLSL